MVSADVKGPRRREASCGLVERHMPTTSTSARNCVNAVFDGCNHTMALTLASASAAGIKFIWSGTTPAFCPTGQFMETEGNEVRVVSKQLTRSDSCNSRNVRRRSAGICVGKTNACIVGVNGLVGEAFLARAWYRGINVQSMDEQGLPHICHRECETKVHPSAASFVSDNNEELPYTVNQVHLSSELRMSREAGQGSNLEQVAHVNNAADAAEKSRNK